MADNTADMTTGEAFRAGLRVLWRGPKWLLLLGALFLATMWPVGRSVPPEMWGLEPSPLPRTAGGLWKPLSVDAGLIFPMRPGADFFSTYEAGARVLRGGDPYSVVPGSEAVRAPYFTTYRYLPIPAYTLGVGLNALPPWWSFLAWIAFNMGLIVANLALTAGRRPGALPLLIAIWCAWFPLAVEWHLGQFTVLMATLILWGLDALTCGARAGGAVAWAGSVALKIYTGAMALPLWLGGRRREAVLGLAVVGVLAGGYFLARPDSFAAFRALNVDQRSLLLQRQPYAGAQGVQEAVNATIWIAQGRDLDTALDPAGQAPALRDPVVWVNGLLIAAYGAGLLWLTWRRRGRLDPLVLGGYWALWFVAYPDCWEHHYVLLQALTAWWLARGVLGPRAAVAVWALAGGPSLWVVLREVLGPEHETLEALVGLAYFWQRPAGLAVLLGAGVWGLRRK